MLPKRRRLVAAEVRDVLRRGRSSRTTHLSLKRLASPTLLRISVVVPKSVAKKAVERNRLRRAVYRALDGFAGEGSAVVFVQKIPRPPLAPAFISELAVLLKTNA